MFIAALFTIAKRQKHPKCPSTDEYGKHHLQAMEHYSALKRKEIFTHAIGMNFEVFSSVQLLSCVQLFATPWTAACQPSLSTTNSQSLLKLMSIELVMPSNHLFLCCLLLLLFIFPSIRDFFPNESVLHIRWPKSWCFSFNINPFKEYSRLISFYVVHAKSLAQGQVSK